MLAKPLAEFCRQFDNAVRPILLPLGNAIEAVERAPDQTGSALLTPLRDAHAHLSALLEKVRDQQGYVLIFGPLKSGKSTLMNALAAAYVSEVSCLPAYPCLVFVSDGVERRYRLTRFDGTTENHEDNEQVTARVQEAHAQLAEHLRAAEAEGHSFDPAVRFPQAIRRIDVRLPAPNLASAGAVLVDTPGLYSRMRFGYSQMTRDFRDAAACAVFVVKSDNLFLEQVFEEFHELLDLFSRIFLIVNVDSTKRDLRPDGELGPSLEQTQPDQIVAAFERLAMTASVKRAHEEGRLRIYPIDLMRAASARVKQDARVQPGDFAAFDRDLTEFLASPAYLAAFLGDSLRRAHALLAAAVRITEHATVAELEQRRSSLEQERTHVRAQVAAAERVLAHPWEKGFAGFDSRARADVQNRAHEIGVKTVRLMEAGLDQWFLSGASVRSLLEQEWRPPFRLFRDQIEAEAKESLDRSLQERDGGMDDMPAPTGELRALGVDLPALRRRAADEILATPLAPVPRVDLDVGAIPVKRALADWALLRPLHKVRAELFGADDGLDNKITAKMKAARLGDAGKRFLRDHLLAAHDAFCRDAARQVVERVSQKVAARTAATLRERIEERRQQLEARGRELDRQWNLCLQVLSPLRKLAESATEMQGAVRALAQQHGIQQLATVEDTVILPAQPPASELAIPARGRLRRR